MPKLTYKARDVNGVLTPLGPCVAKVAVGLSRFKEGEILNVTVESEKKTRSLQANRRYWGLIVPAFAEYCGHEVFPQSAEESGMTPKDSAHQVLKAMFIGRKKITLPDGTEVEVEPSTKSLTTKEFADLQDKAERLLVANGIRLPAEFEQD